jgi:ElaB/YqjD/DUF883 family membrane-anchored ribosome-binding protein
MSDAKDKIKEGIDEASVKANQATERAAEKTKGASDEKKFETADPTGRAKGAIHEGIDLAKKAADVVTSKASDVTAGARDSAENALAKFHEGSEQIAHLGRQGFRDADALVRANPGTSLTLAFGAGIGIGFMLGLALRPTRNQW